MRAMKTRSVTHATFVIERTYPVPVHRVFAAFSQKEAKAKWFTGPKDWAAGKWEMDFRVGGREFNSGGPKDGPVHSFEARYLEILDNERIIYSYEMHMDDTKISVSLATVEFRPSGDKTQLVLTEHGAFLDGHDNPTTREEGTRSLMDALGKSL